MSHITSIFLKLKHRQAYRPGEYITVQMASKHISVCSAISVPHIFHTFVCYAPCERMWKE